MTNTEKFTGLAQTYATYRPAYPKNLLDYLYRDTGFTPECTIADVGAGTGIFSRQLLERGSRVIAVEPNADMLKTALKNLASFPRFSAVSAPAESTSLPDKCADFVTAAQAFHWFDREKFSLECQRILKPGGKVVLLWNHRDPSSPLVQANAQICSSLCPTFTGFSGGIGEGTSMFTEFFKNGAFISQIFDNPLTYDLNEFLGRNLSASYAPRVDSEALTPFRRELTALFKKYSTDGLLSMPNCVRVYIGEV